ncbi:hypothetical protein HK405_005711, partial [Cladochytrium tenue]
MAAAAAADNAAVDNSAVENVAGDIAAVAVAAPPSSGFHNGDDDDDPAFLVATTATTALSQEEEDGAKSGMRLPDAPADAARGAADVHDDPWAGAVSPEETAGPLSTLVFAWMDALFRRGYRKPLTLADLYPLAQRYRAAPRADAFESIWAAELAAAKSGGEGGSNDGGMRDGGGSSGRRPRSPRVWRVLARLFARAFLPIGLLKFLSDSSNIVSTLVLQQLIDYVAAAATSSPPSIGLGLGLAAGMFALNMVASTCLAFFFQRATAYAIAVRATLTSVVYRKALRLSAAARLHFDAGRVTNMVSSDLARMEQFVIFFHLMWTFVVQVAFIVGLLVRVMGASALAGVAILLLMAPLQATIIRALVGFRKRNAATTDQRIRLTGEVLAAMRVVKFFAWEDAFLDRILGVRARELRPVFRANLLRSFVTACGFAIPVLAAAVSYAVYAATSPTFSSSVVFTALALFNQLRNPVMWVPNMVSAVADASVALRRVQELLDSEERDFRPDVDPAMEAAVEVRHGTFSWESPAPDAAVPPKTAAAAAAAAAVAPPPAAAPGDPGAKESVAVAVTATAQAPRQALTDIELTLPRGALVAVVGAVGSGKTSLVASMVGQLRPQSSATRVRLCGAPLYAPQQPWILNTTVRANVLFGREFRPATYARAVAACALRRDLRALPAGDATEIGERGVTLSGGQKQRVSLARAAYAALCEAEDTARAATSGGGGGGDGGNAGAGGVVLLDDPLSAVDAHVGRHIFEQCICGVLKGKTRVFVTHQLHLVPRCDLVISLADGQVAEFGTFGELMAADGAFARLMRSHGGGGGGGVAAGGGANEGAEAEEGVSADAAPAKEGAAYDIDGDEDEDNDDDDDDDVDGDNETDIAGEAGGKGAGSSGGKEGAAARRRTDGRVVEVEDRQTGTLQSSVFAAFAVAMGGWPYLSLVTTVLVFTQ